MAAAGRQGGRDETGCGGEGAEDEPIAGWAAGQGRPALAPLLDLFGLNSVVFPNFFCVFSRSQSLFSISLSFFVFLALFLSSYLFLSLFLFVCFSVCLCVFLLRACLCACVYIHVKA